MEVILLEKVGKLGNIGDVVKVKDGYGRNYLLPRKKALRATTANKEVFESRRAEFNQLNQEKHVQAQQLAEKLNDFTVTLVRQASDDGKLFGSVNAKDVADSINSHSFQISKNAIVLDQPIKYIGNSVVNLHLHSDVNVKINVNIVRPDAASIQA